MASLQIKIENALIERYAQARARQCALAMHWHQEPGEQLSIENLLIAQALAEKGGLGSGNWAHTSEQRRGVGRGGSDPGGGLEFIGAGSESTAAELREAAQRARQRRQAQGGPRSQSPREISMAREHREATEFVRTLEAGSPSRVAVQEYLQELEGQLDQEREINGTLWRIAKTTPDQATESEWSHVADKLHREGYELYKSYDLEGISFRVDELRGAQEDATASLVGGQWVICRRGAFSRKEAVRVKADMWAGAKETLGHEMGTQLIVAGFRTSEIEGTSFRHRRQLLRELGSGRLEITRRSKRPVKIGSVPATARGRVIKEASYKAKAAAARTARDPVDTPTLGAYRKMELADIIRMRYLPQAGEGVITPLHFVE